MWVVTLVTVSAAVAVAQPPSRVPATPDPAESYVYPRRLVDRPLLLPERGLDVRFGFDIHNDQTVAAPLRVAIGTPVFELQLGLDLQLTDRPNRDTSLAALYLGGMREIVPCRVPGLAAGVQLATTYPRGELPGFSSMLVAQYRRQLAPVFTIQPAVSLGYDYGQAIDETDDTEGSVHFLDGSLGVVAQLQAGSVFALEAALSASYHRDLKDAARFALGNHGEQSLTLTMLLAATPNTDLRFAYQRTMRSVFEFSNDGIFLGLAIRRI